MRHTCTHSLGRCIIDSEDDPEDVDEAGNFKITGPGGESPTDTWFVIRGVDHSDDLVPPSTPDDDDSILATDDDDSILATDDKVQHQSGGESLEGLDVDGTAQIQEGPDEPRPGSRMIHPKLNGALT